MLLGERSGWRMLGRISSSSSEQYVERLSSSPTNCLSAPVGLPFDGHKTPYRAVHGGNVARQIFEAWSILSDQLPLVGLHNSPLHLNH